MNCDHCPRSAEVIIVGSDEIRETDFFNLLVQRGVPDKRFCMDCAKRAGFPWLRSEAMSDRATA